MKKRSKTEIAHNIRTKPLSVELPKPTIGRAQLLTPPSCSYEARDVTLGKMGYASYREYLKSPEWGMIRIRVISRDRLKCLICRHKATEVHHLDYDPETLAGACLDRMVALCRICHDDAEFDENGKRRYLEAANARLAARYRDRKGEPYFHKGKKIKQAKRVARWMGPKPRVYGVTTKPNPIRRLAD